MREVAIFVEDYAHEQVIGALVERIAGECNFLVRLDWRNAVKGYGEVVSPSSETTCVTWGTKEVLGPT